jgi:glycosyltransferase involved in cell wall biosynthesis
MVMALRKSAVLRDPTDHSDAASLVSIITPAYQAEDTLLATVSSVLSQTYTHWEMLIVSDDKVDYEAILKSAGVSDQRIRFLSSGQVQSGPNISRNIALNAARGDLIAPLDADDIYYPGRLEKLVPVALEYGMAGDNGQIIDAETRQSIGTLFQPAYGMQGLSLGDFLMIHAPLLFLFRKDIISSPWDEDIELGADTLFNMRGVERVHKVPIFTQPLHEYIIRSGSICHAAHSHLRADRAYSYSLEQLSEGGLGFITQAGRDIAQKMLINKQRINRQYMESLNAGESRHFAEFATMNRMTLLLDGLRLRDEVV